jgi:hypothetical protein
MFIPNFFATVDIIPNYLKVLYFDVLSALDKASLSVHQVATFNPFTWHPSQTQATLWTTTCFASLPNEAPISYKILCACAFSVVKWLPCMWPQNQRELPMFPLANAHVRGTRLHFHCFRGGPWANAMFSMTIELH